MAKFDLLISYDDTTGQVGVQGTAMGQNLIALGMIGMANAIVSANVQPKRSIEAPKLMPVHGALNGGG